MFKIQSPALSSFIARFSKVGIIRIIDLLYFHNGQWKNAQTLADQVGHRSVRSMDGFVNSLKASFPPELLLILNNVAQDAMPQAFPILKVIPKKLGTNINGHVSVKGV